MKIHKKALKKTIRAGQKAGTQNHLIFADYDYYILTDQEDLEVFWRLVLYFEEYFIRFIEHNKEIKHHIDWEVFNTHSRVNRWW